MSLRILTHTIAFTGNCADCGTPLMEYFTAAQPIREGDSVAKIESLHGGTRAYKVGEHDSNQRCVPAAQPIPA